MRSVNFEAGNEGRGQHEWDYLSLGEPRVVAQLIQGRSRLDASYYPKQEAGSHTRSAGVFRISEQILATYMDLDRLIETCGLSARQRQIVRLLMDGYTITDVAEDLCVTKQTVNIQFRRAATKITRQNDEEWKENAKWIR